MSIDYEPTPCVVCGATPVVGINRVSYCLAHIDNGFASLSRTLEALQAPEEDDEH